MISTQKQSHKTSLPHFLAGDIILFAGKNDWYSRLSRWLLRDNGEGPTYAVHTAQFIDGRRVLEMDVVGRIKTVDDILNKRVDLNTWQRRGFEVWRCTKVTPEQRKALTRQSLRYVNIRFGGAKFIMHLFDGLIRKFTHKEVFFFRKLGDYPVCSGITAATYYKALGYRFGVPAECADPDHLYDWVTSHPGEWVRVFELKEFPAQLKAAPQN